MPSRSSPFFLPAFALLLLLLLLSCCCNQSHLLVRADCLNVTDPTQPPFKPISYASQSLPACQWYNGGACCQRSLAEGVSAVLSKVDQTLQQLPIPSIVFKPLEWCMDGMSMFMCAGCAPTTSSFITARVNATSAKTSMTISLCKSMCDIVYDKCKFMPSPTGGGLVIQAYSDGTKFCNDFVVKQGDPSQTFGDSTNETVGVQFKVVESGKDCFSSAHRASASWTWSLLLVLILATMAVAFHAL